MKTLKIYLEDAGLAATPGNTMGMGNPMPPTEGQAGSEPIVPTAKSKKEKCKKYKKQLKESLLDDDDDLFKRTSLNFKDIVDYNHIECYLDNKRCKLSDIAMLDNRGKFNEIRDEQLANKNLKSYNIPKLLCEFDFNKSQRWVNTDYYEEMLKAALNAVISFAYDEWVFVNGLDNYLNPGYFLFWRFNGNRNKDYYKYIAKLNTGEKAELRLYKKK